MESPKSESPRIKWSSDSPSTHLHHSPFQHRSTNATNSQHEKKETEDEQHAQDSGSQPKLTINDENQNTNVPFHLSHHHLLEQNAANKNKKLTISPTQPNFSSPQTQHTSSSSVSSSNHISTSSPYRHMNTSQHHRFRMNTSMNTSQRQRYRHAAHARSTAHDTMQRKLQKLEQDILSKNIQHDIMVNKEEMMGKRLKTKDIRIKNLQNDINKLRDQLTAKTESQDQLITELTEIKQQNRGLSTKLRESNIGLNVSDTEDTHHYNESMRDILNHMQQKLYQLTSDIHDVKQNQLEQPPPPQPEQPQPDIANTIQSCIAPIAQQMKDQQQQFMTDFTSQMQKYEGVLDNKYKAFERENNVNVISNKINEMNQNMQRKMESMNSNHLERYLEQNTKTISSNTQHVVNGLKEEIKREIYGIKSELNAEIKKVKTETHSNIKQITTELKYEIKKDENDNTHNKNTNDTFEYKEVISSQSDAIKQNASKLEEMQQENKQMVESMKKDIASSVHKMRQVSDENQRKTTDTIIGLKPLFDKILNYHKGTDGNVLQTIKENNSDMIHSFTQFKNEFQNIVQSVMSQSTSFISTPAEQPPQQPSPAVNNTKDLSSSVLKEMKRMSSYLERSEFNKVSKNMQQMARRHDEIVKIITNTLPSSMDKFKSDNAKVSEMYDNLTKAIEDMKHHKPVMPVMESPVLKMSGDETANVKVVQQSFSKLDNNMTVKFDRLLQEINSRNVSLFNNVKQINDKQQQYIVKQAESNQKKVIKNHESVLKNHLQQIQLRLSELNQSQVALKQRLNETQCNESNIKEMNEKMLNVTVKENKDVMKEVQLIKNLCNDMHKKSQQLPHFVARNKDLKLMQQSLSELSSLIPSKITPPQPEIKVEAKETEEEEENKTEQNDVMSVLMMPFKMWCENILSQISNHRDNCSIFVIIYVLSQIAFATFAFDDANDDDGDGVLSQIQTRALSLLDEIEKEGENIDDTDANINKQMIIQSVIEWMQTVLNGGDDTYDMQNVWISRTGQEMAHLCHVQLKVNNVLSTIKYKMNELIRKQSKTCINIALCQPLVLGASSIFIVFFCLWLQSIQYQQNKYF